MTATTLQTNEGPENRSAAVLGRSNVIWNRRTVNHTNATLAHAILQVAERLLTVAVGFIPRNQAQRSPRRGATIEKPVKLNFQMSLRDMPDSCARPWDESHGYHHFLAPREVSRKLKSCSKIR